MAEYVVAFTDLMAPRVNAEIARVAPADFTVRFAAGADEAARLAVLADADFILGGVAPITAAMIRATPRLRLIQKWGIGVDKIDLAAARQAGVAVAITFGANAAPVAEHALALMLAVFRRLPYVDRNLRAGRWVRAEMREACFQLAGRTVGLLGFGNVARMLAHRLRGFDVRILYTDIRRADMATETALHARRVPFDELIRAAEVLSVHLPLTAATRGLIGAAVMAAMQPEAVIINTSRGGIVDEAALCAALREGRLLGAGLDVFDTEPLAADHPLLALDNVVLSPHTAGSVFDNGPPGAPCLRQHSGGAARRGTGGGGCGGGSPGRVTRVTEPTR
jgi:phosphoglycerate dehydrogenase-like enzyme